MSQVSNERSCDRCDYQASSARQLSRHKAVTHIPNPLTCVLCPFVTIYQTNLLRHRREVHGILGPKGNKRCKFCSFVAHENEDLIVHQRQDHADILENARRRFAREKNSARGSQSIDDPVSKICESRAVTPVKMEANNDDDDGNEVLNVTGDDDEGEEDLNFWKEGFLDDMPPMSLEYNSTAYRSSNEKFDQLETVSQTPMAASLTSLTPQTSPTLETTERDTKSAGLAPTKIRRNYTCKECSFNTVNPRQFLYHKRDVHHMKVKIVECPQCVYAGPSFQKLQRHMRLVHKVDIRQTPPSSTQPRPLEVQENQRKRLRRSQNDSDEYVPEISSPSKNFDDFGDRKLVIDQVSNDLDNDRNDELRDERALQKWPLENLSTDRSSSTENSLDEWPKETNDVPGYSNYGLPSATSLIPVNQSMESSHLSGIFSCNHCKYRTKNLRLFRNHEKYHWTPLTRCPEDDCDFASPYSWNVERHQRRHLGLSSPDHPLDLTKSGSRTSSGCSSPKLASSKVTTITFNVARDERRLSANVDADIKNQPPIMLIRCRYCEFQGNRGEIINHLSRHCQRKAFDCVLCDFSSNSRHVIVAHSRITHGTGYDVVVKKLSFYCEKGVASIERFGDAHSDEDDDSEAASIGDEMVTPPFVSSTSSGDINESSTLIKEPVGSF